MDYSRAHLNDCLQRLIFLDNTIKSNPYDKVNIIKDIKLYHLRYIEQLVLPIKDIINILNDKRIIECIRFLRNYTTVPNIYDVLDFILLKPDETLRIIPIYRKLGLSNDFIDTLLYRSGRPITDMRPYLRCYNISLKYWPILFPTTNINHKNGENYYLSDMEVNNIYHNCAIPVIRYQTGMSGYLTCGGWNSIYCGTFYYFEPDSEYILFSPYVLVTTNKITACVVLGMDINIIVNVLLEAKGNWMIGEHPDITKDGYPNYMGWYVQGNTKYEQWYNVVKGFYENTINPDVHYHHMYAGEDGLDQPLCELAKSKGITTIILQRMTGETRVVSEILDVRDRSSSFNNLYFPPKV